MRSHPVDVTQKTIRFLLNFAEFFFQFLHTIYLDLLFFFGGGSSLQGYDLPNLQIY